MYHAAVVMKNDNIVLVGGQQRHDNHKRGEIVKSKDGNVISLSGVLVFLAYFLPFQTLPWSSSGPSLTILGRSGKLNFRDPFVTKTSFLNI